MFSAGGLQPHRDDDTHRDLSRDAGFHYLYKSGTQNDHLYRSRLANDYRVAQYHNVYWPSLSDRVTFATASRSHHRGCRRWRSGRSGHIFIHRLVLLYKSTLCADWTT